MVKKFRRRRTAEPLEAGVEIFALLAAMGGSPQRGRLAALWEEWEAAIGADLANQARPLGSSGDALLIGVDNAIQMQELQLAGDELLKRANAWLGCAYFASVRFSIFGQRPRAAAAKRVERQNLPPMPESVHLTGAYLAKMDGNSAVAMAYARFARRSQV